MDAYYSFTKRVDRVTPRSKGDNDSPVVRENYYSRDGRLQTVPGTQRVIDELLTEKCTGMWRYYSRETGIDNPKTIAYTIDGKLWWINEKTKSCTEILTGMKTDAYPVACIYKLGEQYYMYIVDGEYLWEWNGNNSNIWTDKTPKQSDGSSYKPIDVIEHKDRLVLLTDRQVLVSKNLDPTVFNDASDSIEIIVGAGQGFNRAMRKLRDRLYFFNTEGCFILSGDLLSAVASTFSVDIADPNTKVAVGRSAQNVENGIMYLGDDLEVYTFDGNSSKLMSYNENLKTIVNPERKYLDQVVGHYNSVEKRYFLSVVETGASRNNYEIVYDAVEDKIDFIRNRNVSCYCQYNGAFEEDELLLGASEGDTDKRTIRWANRGYNFDGVGIRHRLRTRDIYFSKGQRARISAFYPELEPRGNSDIAIRYLLDGRLSDLGKTTWDIIGQDDSSTQDGYNILTSSSGGTAFTAPQSGYIYTVYAYIGATVAGNSGRIRIWSYAAGLPGTQLAQTNDVFYNTTSGGWKIFTLLAPVHLISGTKYCITLTHTSSGQIILYYNTKVSESFTLGIGDIPVTAITDREFLLYASYESDRTEEARFDQSLAGEQKGLGFINISNQAQFTDRVKPKIDYAQGSSIAFEIDEAEMNNHYALLGIGMSITGKPKIKGKLVGQ